MEFQVPLLEGILLRRYKRFLADIQLSSGEMVTTHFSNSGSMMGLGDAGNPVRLSIPSNRKLKLKYTWEMVKSDGIWVGINTNYPTRLVTEDFCRKPPGRVFLFWPIAGRWLLMPSECSGKFRRTGENLAKLWGLKKRLDIKLNWMLP